MTDPKRGVCLILNNTDFYPAGPSSPRYGSRTGSEIDEDNLKYCFTELGFTCRIHRNLSSEVSKELSGVPAQLCLCAVSELLGFGAINSIHPQVSIGTIISEFKIYMQQLQNKLHVISLYLRLHNQK